MSDDQTYLEHQLDRTEEVWAELIAAMDECRPYDDGSGELQEPGTAIWQSVMEAVPLRAVRITLSTGGPGVYAETIVDRDGTISRPRLIAYSASGHVERLISPGSPLWRVLTSHAIELGLTGQ